MTKTFWFFVPVLFIAHSMPAHSDQDPLRSSERETRSGHAGYLDEIQSPGRGRAGFCENGHG
jgi:hypothetical protein